MGVPAQVLAREEEAEKLQAEMDGKPKLVDAKEPIEEEPVEETPVDPPEIEEEAPVIEEEAQPVKEEKGEDYWEQRFKVMEGKYKAEVPRMSEQIRGIQAKNENLTQLISSMEQKDDGQTFTKGEYLSEEERTQLEEEGFDSKSINLITKMAQRMVKSEFSEPMERKVKEISNDVAVSLEDTFKTKLADAAPDWESINVDKGFLDWLAIDDGYSGMSRHERLVSAYNNKNVKVVAKIFNDYKGGIQVEKKPEPNTNLKKQIAPPRSQSAPSREGGDMVWTEANIKKLYHDQLKGRYDGPEREKEFNKLERSLFKAQNEGRIQP